MCNNKKDFAKGALFGAAIGALIGILSAPASGKETREKIKVKSKDLVDEGKEKLLGAKKEGMEMYSEIKEEAAEKTHEVTSKIRDAVENILEDAAEKVRTSNNKESKPEKKKFNGVK